MGSDSSSDSTGEPRTASMSIMLAAVPFGAPVAPMVLVRPSIVTVATPVALPEEIRLARPPSVFDTVTVAEAMDGCAVATEMAAANRMAALHMTCRHSSTALD